MSTYLGSGDVQHVSITIPNGATSATASINTVGGTAFILSSGWEATQANNPGTGEGRVTLTNSTTVTATRQTSAASNQCTVKCVVVDATANLVKSVQFRTISLASGDLSNTAAIDPVDGNTSVLHCLGWSCAGSSTNYKVQQPVLSWSGTTVTATRQQSGQAMVVSVVMIEFEPTALNSNVQSYSKSWTNSSSSTTQAITSVDPDKSILIWSGDYANDGSVPSSAQQKAALTDGSTVTIDTYSAGGVACLYNFSVVEFAPGVLDGPVQRNTTTLAAVSSNTSAISSVDTTRTAVSYLRNTSNASIGFINNVRSDVALTNGTTVTSSRNGSASNVVTSWEAFQFATGPAPITGAAAVTTGDATASGTALAVFTGTASVTTGNASASATAAERFIATGTATTAPATSSGTAREIFSATSSVTTAPATANGLARETFTGSASVATASATASGVAREIFTGSASPTTGAVTASGSASQQFIATGTAKTDDATANAIGLVTNSTQAATGTVAVTTDDATGTGTAFALLQGFEDVFYIPADDRTYRVPADL